MLSSSLSVLSKIFSVYFFFFKSSSAFLNTTKEFENGFIKYLKGISRFLVFLNELLDDFGFTFKLNNELLLKLLHFVSLLFNLLLEIE